MKRYKPLLILSSIILLACLFGTQGQYWMNYPNDYLGYSPMYYSNNYPYYYSYVNPSFYPSYLPYRYYYSYPFYYGYPLESFPLGTFGLFHGGNFP
jgi:hypothetical protein